MVVTTGGFQSCRWVTSGMSKVRKYPSADPDPPARSRADRRIRDRFFGLRQNGGVGGGVPWVAPPDGGPPAGVPPEDKEPAGPGAGGVEVGRSRLPVVKGPLAARKAA